MALIDDIRACLNGRNIVVDVASVGETIRLETAFKYPDGGSIDLFIMRKPSLAESDWQRKTLTDLAATTEWLMDVQVKPWLSPKRKLILDNALRIYGVSQDGGALTTTFGALDELPSKIVELGQACIRVADLFYTKRSSLQAPIVQELEEIMVDVEVLYETNCELDGPFGKPIRVDLLTMTDNPSAILTLASANASASHSVSNEILRKWYDLNQASRLEQRITVYDDRKDAYREEDLQRLETLSTVVPLSDRQMIADLVTS